MCSWTLFCQVIVSALLLALAGSSSASAVVAGPAAYVNAAPYNLPPYASSVNIVNRAVASPYLAAPYVAAPYAGVPYVAAPYAAAPYVAPYAAAAPFVAPYPAAPVVSPYAAASTPVVAPLKYTAAPAVLAARK